MKHRIITPIGYLSSIKVWSVFDTPNFNEREYRKRLTKGHLFLVDAFDVYNKDKSMFLESTIYLNEHTFGTFKNARKDVVFVLNHIILENSDFWLGDLAKKALEDYSTMKDDLESAHNEYKLCDPDIDGNRVYRFMQIDICQKLLDIGYSHGFYYYTWAPKVDSEYLDILIFGGNKK